VGLNPVDRLRVGRGAARAEDAQGTPTQSHISSSILVFEDKKLTAACRCGTRIVTNPDRLRIVVIIVNLVVIGVNL